LREAIMVVGERKSEDIKLMRSLPIVALALALGTVMTPAAPQSPAEF
jgi:hypothetical protein